MLGRHLSHGTWDSEGLLSTIPAIATALCGVFAGDWLHEPRLARGLRGRVHSVSLVCGRRRPRHAGRAAWKRAFPINKNLWTSSFVAVQRRAGGAVAGDRSTGCSTCSDWRRWSRPFAAFGRNPLAAYFLSVGTDRVLTRWTLARPPGVSLKWVLYWNAFGSWAIRCCSAEAASLLYAIAYIALWAVVVIVMHRRRVY